MITEEQQKIIDYIIDWKNSGYVNPSYIAIGGYAGTGKTFLIGELSHKLRKNNVRNIAFVTYTGKASSVLKKRLLESNAFYKNKGDFIGTIHSLIYRPEFKYDSILRKKIIYKWVKIENLNKYNLIIIDEASMVSKKIWDDLKSYKIPIIVIGDHGQLPPIGDSFSLMKNLHFKLNKIHRQAKNSPIISLSSFVRKNGFIPNNKIFSSNVFKLDWKYSECQKLWKKISFDENVIVLCGFNKTRVTLNNMIRQKLHFIKNKPYPGERIICLKNNHETKIMNGQITSVLWYMPYRPNLYRMTLEVDTMSEPYECLVHNNCFNKETYNQIYEEKKSYKFKKDIKESSFNSVDYFDFGYTISVHKSQGSEWQKVVLFEQRSSYWDDQYYARWLYTAITRAKERLFIISNFY